MRKTLIALLCLKLVACAVLVGVAKETDPAVPAPGGLSLASTNTQMIADVLSRPTRPLERFSNDTTIAYLISEFLTRQHYKQQPFDDKISSKFLDRYVEVLDNLHLHFLDSDLEEFEQYRTTLDDLTYKGDLSPAHVIFSRFLERLRQRVTHVQHLLENETFTFTGDDTYNLNRKEAPRPKDMPEALSTWRQHLRHEILQETLNNEKPAMIADKIARRYTRLLRFFQDYDSQDVFELYLSALTHAYDPHSEYMGKSSLEQFNIQMKLSLFGIGAQLQSEDGYCKIKALIAGGPAEKSKQLNENDRIVAVAQADGEPVDVVDMKLNRVVEMIRGTKGTEVRLTIIPADAADPSVRREIRLVRDEIKMEEQEAKARLFEFPGEQNKIHRLGVIDLPSFYADFELGGRKSGAPPKSTTADVARLIRKLKQENVDGLILDLRRNGGGSLEEAINLTGLFITEGPVVQVRDPNGRISIDSDTDPSVLYDGPLVVLTGRHSASASEILAGALQDYGRALVVGESSTHGKGTVQSLIQLDPYLQKPGRISTNAGALKLTIRKFYRASGASTQLKGVVPDVVLPAVNNHAEIGEAALENPLPWDTIRSAKFEKLGRIEPHLAELRKRSAARVEDDQDFAYVREDIEHYKKAIANRVVSLNQEQRLKEKQEAEARIKARREELKARAQFEETMYEITLKVVDQPGLPEAKGTNDVVKVEAEPSEDLEDEEAADAKIPRVDVALKETKRILLDFVTLDSKDPAVAAARNLEL